MSDQITDNTPEDIAEIIFSKSAKLPNSYQLLASLHCPTKRTKLPNTKQVVKVIRSDKSKILNFPGFIFFNIFFRINF